MKKITLTLVLALCLLATPALSLASSGNALRVQGNASLKVAPDIATLYVGYSVEDMQSATAQQKSAETIDAIVAALTDAGAAEDDISTASLQTYPVYNYTEAGQSLAGYRVEHMLAVHIDDLDLVGTLLDVALSAGANQANSISYESSREKEVYLQALALAVDNATRKAEALAVASGLWLGSLCEVNEASTYGGVARYAEAMAYDSASGSSASMGKSIMTGDLEISASVELVYAFR